MKHDKRKKFWRKADIGGGHQSKKRLTPRVDPGLDPAVVIVMLDEEGAPNYHYNLRNAFAVTQLLAMLEHLALEPYDGQRVLIAPSVDRVSYTFYSNSDYVLAEQELDNDDE